MHVPLELNKSTTIIKSTRQSTAIKEARSPFLNAHKAINGIVKLELEHARDEPACRCTKKVSSI